MLRIIACAVSCSFLACTFGTVGPPDRPRPGVRPECTESYAVPIVEATVGALVGGYGAYLGSRPECPERSGGEGCDLYGGRMTHFWGGLPVLTGVVLVGGSLVGFSRVSKCRAAVATYAEAPTAR